MDWVACVGFDWGGRGHAYEVRDRNGAKRSGLLENTAERLHEWAQSLRDEFPEGRIVLVIEQCHAGLLSLLAAYELTIVPLNPRASKLYRQSRRLSGASSDQLDAELLCEYGIRHMDELQAWEPDDRNTRKLRLLNENRRDLVDQRTECTHRLAAALGKYFPQALQWFGGETAPFLRAMLLCWPTLQALLEATPEQITAVYKKERRRKIPAAVKELLEKRASAKSLTADQAIIDDYSFAALSLLPIIDELSKQIVRYDKAIREVWATHQDREIFDSLPGAGPVLAPRLAAAFGTDRNRFSSDDEVQCYSGIAPVTEQSGNSQWVHARWAFPKFLHQTFHEFAASSIKKSKWAKQVYREQRLRGAGHQEAIRALAFRWIRILFKLWKDRQRYDEAVHLERLKLTGSPIYRRMVA